MRQKQVQAFEKMAQKLLHMALEISNEKDSAAGPSNSQAKLARHQAIVALDAITHMVAMHLKS